MQSGGQAPSNITTTKTVTTPVNRGFAMAQARIRNSNKLSRSQPLKTRRKTGRVIKARRTPAKHRRVTKPQRRRITKSRRTKRTKPRGKKRKSHTVKIMAFMTTMHTEDVALFSNPPYNTAEDKIFWTQYHPSYANIGQEGYNSIHFDILGNVTQYIDLSKIKLYIKLRVQKEDGSVWGADESGLPIDMILHTMWSSVDVALNNVQVSGAGGNYIYKATIDYLLNYSKNTKEIQLQSIGMSPDNANFDSVKPGNTAGGTLAINSGLLSRKALFGGDGSTYKVSIRIYCDFLNIYGKFTFLAITLDLIKIFEFCLNI